MIFGPGDIIGFSGRGLVSDIINIATYGIPRIGISHVAVVGTTELLYESTTLNNEPCAVQHRLVRGVQAHTIDTRIAAYDGKVFHYPLSTPLDQSQSTSLLSFLNSLLGTSYNDIGAFRRLRKKFSWVESQLHRENLRGVFCWRWSPQPIASSNSFRRTTWLDGAQPSGAASSSVKALFSRLCD